MNPSADDAVPTPRSGRSARPVRRANPLPAAEDESAPDGQVEDSVQPASLRPRRRSVAASEQSIPEPAEALAPGAALRPRRRPAATLDTEVAETSRPRRRTARRKRSSAPAVGRDFEQEHVSPPVFVRQSVGELRKVIWPSGQQLGEYFVVVLAFVLFIITFVGLLDLFFGWGLLKILGN